MPSTKSSRKYQAAIYAAVENDGGIDDPELMAKLAEKLNCVAAVWPDRIGRASKNRGHTCSPSTICCGEESDTKALMFSDVGTHGSQNGFVGRGDLLSESVSQKLMKMADELTYEHSKLQLRRTRLETQFQTEMSQFRSPHSCCRSAL